LITPTLIILPSKQVVWQMMFNENLHKAIDSETGLP
jgi:hypothetical protein